MGMAEIRDAFEAYATGELAESELRSALRAEVQTQPGSVPGYAAMAAALRRRRLISAELEAAVISDMNLIVENTNPPRTAADVQDAPTGLSVPRTGPGGYGGPGTQTGSLSAPAPRSATGPRNDTAFRTANGARNAAAMRAPTSSRNPPAFRAVTGARTNATTTTGPQNGSQANLPPRTGTVVSPPSAVREASRASSTGNRSTGAGNGKALGWDAQEKLAEPEAPIGVGTTLRERFELVEVLGRGGMGVVYKAIDQRDVENKGREPYVAIKVLNEEFKRHPESARALQRESKKAMRLAHPNIVLVRDFDRDCGNVFMVMELLHGTPLDQVVLRQYPKGMPLELVIEVVTGLCAALSYAHQHGIVHADFKPSNAFLTTQNAVKVLDFGVARVALALDRNESTIFDAGKLNAVSPAYASVELLIGEPPDPRDDIYALACVTYFLLTARHPYNGVDAVKARDSELQPKPIPGLPDPQWRALRAALVFDRWDRTPSVREFLTQFSTMQRGGMTGVAAKVVTATGDAASSLGRGVGGLLETFVRRPWLWAIPALALLLVLGVAFTMSHRPPFKSADTAAVLSGTPAPVVSGAAALETPAPDTKISSEQALQQRVAAINPAAPDFIDTAVAAAADIRSLAGMSPDDPTVQRLRAALQNALGVQVESMLARNDLSSARRLVTKVGPVLPAMTLRAYSSDALVRRQQLIRLMDAPEPTQRWADQMAAGIADLAALAPADDPMIREARERSDVAFVAAAQQARAQQRTDDARESLATGMTVNPQSTSLSRAAAALADDRPMPMPAAARRATASAPIGAAAASVATPGTGAMPAVASLAPAPAPSVAESPAQTPGAPRAVQAIIAQAKQQMSDADTEAALATLAAGRRKFGSSPALKDLEITYDRVEEEYERIDMAPTLNIKAHEEWLAEIRSLAGDDDYRQIEQMLARTLSHDIAEQRARADRPTVVAALLTAGHKLFPDYASLLDEPQVAATEKGGNGVTDASATR